MPSRIEIIDIGALAAFKSRLAQSGEVVASRMRRADGVAAGAIDAVSGEVNRRTQVYESCRQDPEANCSAEQQAMEEARSALGRLQTAVGHAAGEARPLLTGIRHRHAVADAYMSSVIAGVDAVHGPAGAVSGGLGAAALAGATGAGAVGGGGGGGGGLAAGALDASGTAAMEAAMSEWTTKAGLELNEALRNGSALTASQASLAAGLDEAFDHAVPTTSATTFDRGVGRTFLTSLGMSPYASDAEIAAAVDGGRLPAAKDPGYLAVSSDLSPYFAEKPIRLHVEVPPGSKILDLRGDRRFGTGPISAYPHERELVLPRGGGLAVIPGSARVEGGVVHVGVRYVPGVFGGA